tara:strand:- start:120 stop:431 length:312 start_codon:yes stop_codon:yes gene_type:complete
MKIQKTLIIAIISLGMTSGCSLILPWPVSTTLSVADIYVMKKTGKSTSEHIAGDITQKDCKWWRLLEEEKVCMTEKEYVDYLLKMNCEEYEWNIVGMPQCKGE